MTETEPAPNVYEEFRRLRTENPVSREDGGPWRVVRYKDVFNVLRDFQTFSSRVAPPPPQGQPRPPSMLFSDPPVHTRLRKLVGAAFSPRAIREQREVVEKRCEELVQKMCEQDRPDLVYELASPLPVTVIAHMLGVADGPLREFKRWSDAIFRNIGETLQGRVNEESAKAVAEMDAFFLEKIAALREHKEPYLLGHLVQVETDTGKLTDAELLMFCRLLLIAGNETTTGLITGCVRVFDQFPETLARLKVEPDLIPSFVEETLRYYSPFQLTVRRATRDVELAGVKIGAGDMVLPMIASANRDDDQFEGADRFVIDRDPNPHLAFGYGVHSCLGSVLARMEGQIAVASLVRHLDHICLAEPDQVAAFGAPATLPVEIRRAA